MKKLMLKKILFLMLGMLCSLAQANMKLKFDAVMAKHPEKLRKRIEHEVFKFREKNAYDEAFGAFFELIPDEIIRKAYPPRRQEYLGGRLAHEEPVGRKVIEKIGLGLFDVIGNTTEESIDSLSDTLNAQLRKDAHEIAIRMIKIMGAKTYKQLAEHKLKRHQDAYNRDMALLARMNDRVTKYIETESYKKKTEDKFKLSQQAYNDRMAILAQIEAKLSE